MTLNLKGKYKLGTCVGGCLSVVFFVILIFYAVVQIQMMNLHSLDAKYEFRTFFDLENEVGTVSGDDILFDFAY